MSCRLMDLSGLAPRGPFQHVCYWGAGTATTKCDVSRTKVKGCRCPIDDKPNSSDFTNRINESAACRKRERDRESNWKRERESARERVANRRVVSYVMKM